MAPVRSYTNWNSRTTDEEEQIEPYHDVIMTNGDDLYNRISFPVDDVDEDRYHTCYNIMYVLYHLDAEKFLQYCEELKEDCDNMSRHRIDVLIEEIVKK